MQHLLIEILRGLVIQAVPVCDTLTQFSSPKAPTVANFKAGVELYTRIANMLPSDRVISYGTTYGGLYTNNHLAEVWNQNCAAEERIAPHTLDGITPDVWEIIAEDHTMALRYSGSSPASALDQLLLGPSVIDCGMFCQLGVYFGLRYVLGDREFDAHFGKKPLLVTRFLYEGEGEKKKAHLVNPLFAFFAKEPMDSVFIEHIFNHPMYPLKHPGGNCGGQNCLVIAENYHIFRPITRDTSLPRDRVVKQLLDAYNAEPDQHDQDALIVFGNKDNAEFFQACYGSIYQFDFSVIAWYKMMTHIQSFRAEFISILASNAETKKVVESIYGSMDALINSFDLKSSAEKYRLYGLLFETPIIHITFKMLLESKPSIYFEIFYSHIFHEFKQEHESLAQHQLSSISEIQKLSMGNFANVLYFDFNRFIRTVMFQTPEDSSTLAEEPVFKKNRVNSTLTMCPSILFDTEEAASSPQTTAAHALAGAQNGLL